MEIKPILTIKKNLNEIIFFGIIIILFIMSIIQDNKCTIIYDVLDIPHCLENLL